MFSVSVENGCSCFKKSGFSEKSSFETLEQAKEEAEYIYKIMQSNFCQKHTFELVAFPYGYTIYIKSRD